MSGRDQGSGRDTPARRAGPKGRPGASVSKPVPKPGAPGRSRPKPPPPPPATIKRNLIRAGIAFVALGVVVGGIYWYGDRPKPASADAKRLAAQASAAATAAGCSAVKVVAPYPNDLDRAHVGTGVPALPPLSSYPSVPPASGPHEPVPLDAGVYAKPPHIGNAIHSLEHGAVIVWYSPADADEASALGTFFAEPENEDHIIVAPYDYPDQGTAGVLPTGVGMALVAWHHIQTCRIPSLPVAVAFALSYSTPTRLAPICKPHGYLGDAPERCFAI